MLVLLRRPGGNHFARAAMVLNCLQFGAVLFFMTVHDHMLQWQSLGFSNTKHRSNPCWFDCYRLPAYTGSQGRVERSTDSPQDRCLQCSKCQPGRKLVGQCSAAEHLSQRLPNFRPKTSYASTNHSAISVVLPVSSDCWLLCLWSSYCNLRIFNNRKKSCLWR